MEEETVLIIVMGIGLICFAFYISISSWIWWKKLHEDLWIKYVKSIEDNHELREELKNKIN